MNKTTMVRPLFLSLLLAASWSVAAADEDEALQSECRSVAQTHGVAAEQLDAWVKRCVDNARMLRGEMTRDRQESAPHGDHRP